MTQDRYVLLGVAPARADWFRRVGQWATAASVPAEFVRCISTAELQARLTTGRPFSAVLADAAVPGIDRDLVAAAAAVGVPVIVVDDGRARTWEDIGVAVVLPPDLDREILLEALAQHADTVGSAVPRENAREPEVRDPRAGTVLAVTGPGGAGASTVAIALAQGLAIGPQHGSVLLADFCRAADQAMLHDSRVVVPGVQELVEAHRSGVPSASDVRSQTFAIAGRGYRLLLGLRRARHWVTIRPQAFEATLDSLQRSFSVVVADIDPDLEGEDETGSVDVEERHLMARATAARASVVFVVGHPGMKGLHALLRVVLDLLQVGVPPGRVVPVLVPAPRSPRDRAELSTSLGSLASASLGASASQLVGPLFLPRRPVDNALRDGVPVPRPLPELLSGAATAILARAGARTTPGARADGATLVRPGSLSMFTSQEGSP